MESAANPKVDAEAIQASRNSTGTVLPGQSTAAQPTTGAVSSEDVRKGAVEAARNSTGTVLPGQSTAAPMVQSGMGH
jgi:hypothetical protein